MIRFQRKVLLVLILTIATFINKLPAQDYAITTLIEQNVNNDDRLGNISDLLVDWNGNIYIADYKDKIIYKYDNSGNELDIINIPDDKFRVPDGVGNDIKLGVDGENNLYILTLFSEYWYSALKYNPDLKTLETMSQIERVKMARITEFFVSYSGNIYVYRSVITPSYSWKNCVLMYDNNGGLLGEVDYWNEDIEGNVYKSIPTHQDITIAKYEKPENMNGKPSSFLKQLGKITMNRSSTGRRIFDEDRWKFVGTDNNSNFYLFNRQKVKIFDKNFNMRDEINIVDYLDKKKLRFIQISPDGEIITCSVKHNKFVVHSIGYNNK